MGCLIGLAVIAFPILEIVLWVKLAGAIGFWPCLGLTAAAMGLGLFILRGQGLAMLLDARSRMSQGALPVDAAFDSLCFAAAGALLVLPGFLTDALALALLAPPTRQALKSWVAARLIVVGTGAPGPTVIDGEFTEVEPETKRLEP